ncbi:EAL domain-containing protein [bacterium]|nr:EAL domain-containing protein [bacterium]
MENVYLARQPIVNGEGYTFAYELLYRDIHQQPEIDNDRYASASVISNVLNKFGTRALLSKHKAFIKVDNKFLMSDVIFSIPGEFFIFTLLESVEITERVIERMEKLRDKGYELAINDVYLDMEKIEKYTPVIQYLSYFKINVSNNIGNQDIRKIISNLRAQNIGVVATKIEDKKHYELAKQMGCTLYQGYFFAEPNIIENKKFDATQLSVIKLYNMLMQDTNIDEITSEFEHNYAISIQLLQFINSASFHFKTKISSIHHVLVLVGRKPLAQWLMLMIYSKSVSKTGELSPLMLMVKNRTELMENLLKAVRPDVKSNALGEAYFVGVLSLIDTVFGMKLEEILDHINISQEIQYALLNDEGILGELYALVRDIEAFNTKAISDFAQRHKISSDIMKEIIVKSIENVNNFEEGE